MAIKISGTTVIPDALGSAEQVLRINAGGTAGEWADSTGGIDYVYKTANYTANANEGVITDTTGGAFTVTLPASPSVGDLVVINDADGNWDTANLIVARNGSTIDGAASNMTMDVNNASVDFIYDGTTWGVYSQAGFVTTSATYASTEFTATAAQTTFSVSYTAGLVDVYLNGVKLAAADFTATNGTSVVLTAGAALNDIVEVVAWASYDVANVATAGQGALAATAVQPTDSFDAGNLINALPAISGAALTSLNSASLSGALPAISGAALTGISSGGYQFISSIDISSDATAEFTGFNSALYDSYEFVVSHVLPATDGTFLYMRTSSNGGTSYDSGNGNYTTANSYDAYNTGSRGGSNTTNVMVLAPTGVGTASGEQGVSGVVELFSPHTTKRTYLSSDIVYEGSDGKHYRTTGVGARLTNAVVNGIQFYYSSGNLASGTITMYGKVNS